MISLSVIVCTRNRPQQLRNCLVRIGSLAPPAGVTVEVLVVNNGPRDGVADLVADVAQGSPLSFHYLEEPARGLAHGRNRGLRAARGRLIAFTDDDCLPADDWLAALVTVFDERPEVDLLGGRVELHDPSDRRVTVKTKPEREVLESATGLDGLPPVCPATPAGQTTGRTAAKARTGRHKNSGRASQWEGRCHPIPSGKTRPCRACADTAQSHRCACRRTHDPRATNR
jgi:glycosyltransferase involved in cell wall biosynthesis